MSVFGQLTEDTTQILWAKFGSSACTMSKLCQTKFALCHQSPFLGPPSVRRRFYAGMPAIIL